MIRTYDRNSREADKFGLESSDSDFQMDGKVIDYLFYVFEARTSLEAYAIVISSVSSSVSTIVIEYLLHRSIHCRREIVAQSSCPPRSKHPSKGGNRP
jgi:hypothetical protein